MIVLTFLGGLGSGFMVAAACQAPPQAFYEVTLAAEPVTIGTDYSLADIQALARSSSAKAGHPPAGFYIGTFGYSIDVVRNASPGLCSDRIAIHISMSVSRRRIEIARELSSRKCLYSAFLSHYEKHADDDVVLIETYRALADHLLQERSPSLPDGEHVATTVYDAEIARSTARTIETALQGFSERRATAAERVDTPDEVRRLTYACADHA